MHGVTLVLVSLLTSLVLPGTLLGAHASSSRTAETGSGSHPDDRLREATDRYRDLQSRRDSGGASGREGRRSRGGDEDGSGGGSGRRGDGPAQEGDGSGRRGDGQAQGDDGSGGGDRPGSGANKPTEIPAGGWKEILKRSWAEQKADNIGLLAAGCAYYAFLAIFPALIAAVTVYGLVASPEDVTRQVQNLLSGQSQEVQDLLAQPLTNIANQGSGALGLGLLLGLGGALFSASGGMQNFMKAINIAYDETDDRGFVELRGTALLLTLGGVIFFVVTIAVIGVVPAVLQLVDLGPVGSVLASIAPFLILLLFVVAALAVLYRYAPDRDDARFSWTSLGAGFATVVWLLATVAFFFYVRNFGSYSATYGALAGVIILLFFFYITAFIFLFGAEINAEAEKQTVQDTTKGEPQSLGDRGAVAADEPVDPDGDAEGSREEASSGSR